MVCVMRFPGFVAIAGLLLTMPALAAGIQMIDLPADMSGPALHGAIWSPCAKPQGEFARAVKDCPVNGGKLPLVVFSHGRGGTFNGHQDTAGTLADAGFVVAAINHPGDTATDMSHFYDLSVYIDRPTDIKRLIDYMLGASTAASKIDPRRIGLFGFSRGGYTGLVLVGADPDWAHVTQICEGSSLRVCDQVRRKEYPAGPLTHDSRIKAAVIADPPATVFGDSSFAAVRVPVQLWQSERGGDGVEAQTVAAVDKNLPAPHEYRIVPNAGHFAFLTPCPAELAEKRPELCTDAPGFDRVVFHKQFDADVLAFFRAHLVDR